MNLKLNFVAVRNSFPIMIWRKPIGKEKIEDDSLKNYKLLNENGLLTSYLVSFNEYIDFDKIEIQSNENYELAKSYLLFILNKYCVEHSDCVMSNRRFNPECYKTISVFPDKGRQVISIRPYFYRTEKEIGFLLNFKFQEFDGVAFDKEVQRLSLSLDKNYRSNRYYYLDKHKFLMNFLKQDFSKMVTFFSHKSIVFQNELRVVESYSLKPKTYLFKNKIENNSQFYGVKTFGPYKQIDKNVKFVFVFEDKFKDLANKVFFGLKGDLSPGTFTGMTKMFQIPFLKENVIRIPISGYSNDDLNDLLNKIREEKSKSLENLIVVFIEPTSNYDNLPDDSPYYFLKYHLTKDNIPVQFLTHEKLKDPNSLKWSISNIGLQLFSKLGGIPWLVKPNLDNTLILGIGSSHEFDDNGQIKKYFAYTVCLDATGLYKKIASLASSDSHDNYIESLQKNLRYILNEYKNYQKVSLHLPFKIKKAEINAINAVIENYGNNLNFEVIKINDNNDFMAFSSHNSMIPYESSVVKLSKNQFLVWFEGLNFGKENVHKKIGRPVHLEFLTPMIDDGNNCMQDVLNLSGANWRGFNSKQIPVSIYYAQIVAKYLKGFKNYEDEGSEIFDNISPWFL